MSAIDNYIAILAVTGFTLGTIVGWYVRSAIAIRDKRVNLSEYENTGA